jgi:glycosyltransferase involved in cell wall biosynthesis
MTKPIVSIITPTYNHERFIGQCIESVLSQTFSDWEMIIVDDESTDATKSVIRNYVDRRITYIRQEHVGPYRMSETYNRALDRAGGEFIAILEGDDLWPCYKLERQLPLLDDRPDAVACYGRAGTIDDSGNPLGFYPSPQLATTYATTREFILRQSWVQPVTVLIRRDALMKIGGFLQDQRLPIVDLPTWLQLSLDGSFQFQDIVLGLWRKHDRQVTANYSMSRGAHEIAFDFYRTLPPEKKREIGITGAEIRQVHRNFLAEDGWSTALVEMNNRRWRQARWAARAALGNGSGFRRLEAAAAIGCTLVHFNPTEAIATVAKTGIGKRLLERHNPLAREQRPELLAALLEAEVHPRNVRVRRSTSVELMQ